MSTFSTFIVSHTSGRVVGYFTVNIYSGKLVHNFCCVFDLHYRIGTQPGGDCSFQMRYISITAGGGITILPRAGSKRQADMGGDSCQN